VPAGGGGSGRQLSQSQALEPAALQQALAHDGIRALVEVKIDCSSNPAPPAPTSIGVVSLQLPDGTPVAMPTMQQPGAPIPADAVIVIKPSAMPAGTELFVGFRSFGALAIPVRLKDFHLIEASSYTCRNGFPPGGPGGT
jgi:hypothetical protein